MSMIKYKQSGRTPMVSHGSHMGTNSKSKPAYPIYKTITRTGSNFRTAKNTVCFGGKASY